MCIASCGYLAGGVVGGCGDSDHGGRRWVAVFGGGDTATSMMVVVVHLAPVVLAVMAVMVVCTVYM
jgi:hypothetical protein